MARLIIWTTILSVLVGVYLHLRRRGAWSFHAPWMIVLLLLPTWFVVSPGGLRVNPRDAAAIVILLVLVTEGIRQGPRLTFVLTDLIVALSIIGQIASTFSNGEAGLTIPYNLAREWGLPYALGRMFIRGWWDLDRALPGICIAATALSGIITLEAVSHIHFYNKLVGGHDGVWFLDYTVRWGMRRPVGPQQHSIYVGLTMAMMMPWLLEAWRRSIHGRGPDWWKWTPWIMAVGIFCSTSRGAQVVALCAVVGDVFFRKPQWRSSMLIGFAALGIAFVAMREEIVDALSSYAGESKEESYPVKIDGETYEYSGTHHRELISIAYKEAVAKTGLLGFARPTKIPRPADLDNRLISVDDHYLYWTLLYGDLGFVLFVWLMVCGWYYLITVAWSASGPFAPIAGGLAGVMLGMGLALRSVWFAEDFGQVWLFTTGVAASLWELRRNHLQAVNAG